LNIVTSSKVPSVCQKDNVRMSQSATADHDHVIPKGLSKFVNKPEQVLSLKR